MRYGPKRSTDQVPNWYSAYRYMSSKRRARGSFSLNVDSEKFRVGINTLEPLTDTIILRTGRRMRRCKDAARQGIMQSLAF